MAWSKVSNPIEQAKVWPWLMHISKQDGMCRLFDPLRGEVYIMKIDTFFAPPKMVGCSHQLGSMVTIYSS